MGSHVTWHGNGRVWDRPHPPNQPEKILAMPEDKEFLNPKHSQHATCESRSHRVPYQIAYLCLQKGRKAPCTAFLALA